MIASIHCVRRFAPALPLRGTSLREDGLHEATDAVLPITTIKTSPQFGLPSGTPPDYI
jgi:hypothetical protein